MGIPRNSVAGRAVAKALKAAGEPVPPPDTPEDRAAAAVAAWCRANGRPEPVRGYKFMAPERRFAFDLAFPDQKVAVEFEGGLFTRGRHVRVRGYESDAVKYTEAAIRGWLVIRVSYRQYHKGLLYEFLTRAFRVRG